MDVQDTTDVEECWTGSRDRWIQDGDGFLLVYSLTSRASFELIRGYHQMISSARKTSSPPFLIVANKSDREQDRKVSSTEGAALAHELGNYDFIETSALDTTGVECAITILIREMRESEKSR